MYRQIRMVKKALYLVQLKKCIIFRIMPWRLSFCTYFPALRVYPAQPLIICTWIYDRDMIFFKKYRKLITQLIKLSCLYLYYSAVIKYISIVAIYSHLVLIFIRLVIILKNSMQCLFRQCAYSLVMCLSYYALPCLIKCIIIYISVYTYACIRALFNLLIAAYTFLHITTIRLYPYYYIPFQYAKHTFHIVNSIHYDSKKDNLIDVLLEFR